MTDFAFGVHCPHCGKLPDDPMRPGQILRERRKEKGLTQLQLLDRATELSTGGTTESLLRRDTQWVSRAELANGPPSDFGELEALCAALDLDPAKTSKGEAP